MDLKILLSNLTNPTLLYFVRGIFATIVRSDLKIPSAFVKFTSLYLLLSIGFRGGQELAHSDITSEIYLVLLSGIFLAAFIPFYSFFILKRKMNPSDAGAVAASYGSVSAVTFVAAVTFLELLEMHLNGHMVAVMALMEAPAIIVGVILINRHETDNETEVNLKHIIKHSFTNGSVLMILGSLIIGIIADSKQAEGIKPFTNDIFKGFLAIFLLEMGMITARRFAAFRRYGWFAFSMAIVLPLVNGTLVAMGSSLFMTNVADRFILSVLAASASYIAVPAAMRIAAPNSDPGLYLPMALGVTFPFNITFGMPIYMYVVGLFN